MQRAVSALLIVIFSLGGFALARAGAAKVEAVESAPEGASPEIRAALGPGIRVAVDGKPAAWIWLSKEIPVSRTDKATLGANYARIPEGTLVGVARLPENWTDYRGKPVAAGTYTMRYALEPADGNHMGVSEFRDFLLLAPVLSDADPRPVAGHDLLYQSSRKASGTNHPAVLCLLPVPKDAAVPSVLASQGGTVTVAVRSGASSFGLVVKGHAEE